MSRVMVIDDELHVRKLLRRILEDAGYSVSDAPDGKKALDLWRHEPTDVVITDMYMPIRDGAEVIMEMTGYPVRPAIIAMSGGGEHRFMDLTEAALLLGADRVLSKPLDRHTVLRTVEQVLATPVPTIRGEGIEERKHARYAASFSISLENGVSTWCGTVTDISLEGCRIHTHDAPPKERYFRLDICPLGQSIKIALAVMRWARGNEYGVEFIRISSGDHRRLHDVVRDCEVASRSARAGMRDGLGISAMADLSKERYERP